MAHGQIAADKKRVISIMPKTLASELEKLAKENNRTVSNYIVHLVEKELNRSNTRA